MIQDYNKQDGRKHGHPDEVTSKRWSRKFVRCSGIYRDNKIMEVWSRLEDCEKVS